MAGNEVAKTIVLPTITDIPVNDIKISIRQKANLVSMAQLMGFHQSFQQIKKD